MSKKDVNTFLKVLSKLDPVDFIGVARILNVDTLQEKVQEEDTSSDTSSKVISDQGATVIPEGEETPSLEASAAEVENLSEKLQVEKQKVEKTEPRKFEEILSEMVEHFTKLSNNGKKNLITIREKAVKQGRSKKHGNRSSYSTRS